MKQEIGRWCRGRRGEESLYGCVSKQAAMHRGAKVACNCFVERGGNINEPLVLHISGFRGQVGMVFSRHEARLVKNCKKAFPNVPDRLNDTRLDSFATNGRVVS